MLRPEDSLGTSLLLFIASELTKCSRPQNNWERKSKCHTDFIARNVKYIKVLNETNVILQPKMKKKKN